MKISPFYFILIVASGIAQNLSAQGSTHESEILPYAIIVPRVDPPANPVKGMLIYHIGSQKLAYFDGLNWVEPDENIFIATSTSIRSIDDHFDKNFLIGSPQINSDGNFDHDKRMFFHKEKGAFRAGDPFL